MPVRERSGARDLRPERWEHRCACSQKPQVRGQWGHEALPLCRRHLPPLPRALEGAEAIIWDGAEWVELRLEEEGLAWDEDRIDTLVTEPWYLGLGDASCKGKKSAG